MDVLLRMRRRERGEEFVLSRDNVVVADNDVRAERVEEADGGRADAAGAACLEC